MHDGGSITFRTPQGPGAAWDLGVTAGSGSDPEDGALPIRTGGNVAACGWTSTPWRGWRRHVSTGLSRMPGRAAVSHTRAPGLDCFPAMRGLFRTLWLRRHFRPVMIRITPFTATPQGGKRGTRRWPALGSFRKRHVIDGTIARLPNVDVHSAQVQDSCGAEMLQRRMFRRLRSSRGSLAVAAFGRPGSLRLRYG